MKKEIIMDEDIMITEKFVGIVDEPNPKGSEDTLDIYRHADKIIIIIKTIKSHIRVVFCLWDDG